MQVFSILKGHRMETLSRNGLNKNQQSGSAKSRYNWRYGKSFSCLLNEVKSKVDDKEGEIIFEIVQVLKKDIGDDVLASQQIFKKKNK